MKWRGMTAEAREHRRMEAREIFTWFPVQCECGTWVWFEKVWTKTRKTMNNGRHTEYALTKGGLKDWPQGRPPPPSPIKSAGRKKPKDTYYRVDDG